MYTPKSTILNVDFALKLRIYRSLKSVICLKRILKNMSTHCILSLTTLHCRSVPLSHSCFLSYQPQDLVESHYSKSMYSGHYSIDCILAYYVTTRMWWIYHTLAHNNILKTRGAHNFLDQMWWWLIFRLVKSSKIEKSV